MLISKRNKFKLLIPIIITAVLMLAAEIFPEGYQLVALKAAEVPAAEYYGSTDAESLLGNLRYTDVSDDVWSREAILQTGALGIIKGIGDSRFGRNVPLTKEEAIAVVYRAAGREAEALQLGTDLNNARPAANRKTDPQEVLYDGFLQLAANDGLITAVNLKDALSADQAASGADSFKRKSNVQRQEIAYWLAKALNIQPVAQQQELLNYSDWRSTDPDKLPYMEAILRQGIINGSVGRINPKQSLTREQAAQIVKNAENSVLSAKGYIKNIGTVEDMETSRDYTGNKAISLKDIIVRNSDGRIAAIHTSVPSPYTSGTKNENSGAASPEQKKELIVYKNGALGNSSLLSEGDRIEYITDIENTVKYVHVISNVNEVRYLAVQINYVNKSDLQINVIELFRLDYPDLQSISGDISFSGSLKEKTTYRMKASATVSINGSKAAIGDITDDATGILTIGSDNIVREIQCVDLGINSEARKIVRGIVEDNNPDLGYITLYNEDGSGAAAGNSALLRTYNYVDQNKTEILRNYKPVKADSIQAGDTAYIKLDNDGDIASISAVDNYTVKYARVLSKMPGEIAVEFDDGSQQLLTVNNDVIVIREKLLTGFKALKDGDRVKLLLNETHNAVDLKEITIEGDEHFISNIYKGIITKVDVISGKITVMGLMSFKRGSWERTDKKGFTTIPIAEDFNIYSGETELDAEDADTLLYSNEAYIAVEKGYGNVEEAVVLSYKNSEYTSVPTASDSLTGVVSGSGSFMLSRENQRVNYMAGSIVVKYGRLVTGNSLSDSDQAYLALNRDNDSGACYASVVKVDEPQNTRGLTLYRGRISAVNEEKDFAVESFSELQGTSWIYNNTPKTFNITLSTRVLNEDGVLNVRDFKGYGDDSYINRTVYVLSDGVNAVLVSDAPYGSINIKGTVYKKEGTEIDLRNVRIYDTSSFMWVGSGNTAINILKNSIIIKDGRTASYSDIENGTAVRILKNNAGTSGDGFVIFIE